jgi:uncharacterized protein affecting Mg2+/Co2+ transport
MRNTAHRFLAFFGLVSLTIGFLVPRTGSAEPLKPDQLVGSWVRTNVADISGLEFAKGGKVSEYYGGADEAMTSDYSIGADGRLNLSMGGLSSFFLPTLSGDQLTLKDPDSGKIAQYRRLKAGETMAAAIAAQKGADVKLVQDRNTALPAFLQRKDLVMVVINGGKAFPASSALELLPNGNDFAGHICFDGTPPHLDSLGAEFQGSRENPSIAIWFGPGNAQQNKLMFLFHAVGTAPDISLISKVNLSNEAFAAEANTTVIIKAAADVHKQILEHLKTETARLEALKAPIVAMLKDYVVLKGTSQSNLPSERSGFADQFTLSRNPQNNTWVGQGQLVNRATGATEIFPAMAGVGIVGEKPIIQILSQKRVYQFSTIDAAGGKLSGAWQMPQNPNSRPAELAIAQALDAKGRDQLFAASKKALQQIGAGTIYHGILNEQGNNERVPPNPVTVTLTVAANGTISGKAEYPLEGCAMTLGGREIDTPLGPQLQVQYTGGQSNPDACADAAAFMNAVQHEAWLLSPSGDPAGPMRLIGYSVTNSLQRTLPVSLQLIPYADKDKAAMIQELTTGAQFKMVYPRMDAANTDILAFSGDAATGQITGRLTSAGHQLNNAKGTTFTGEIKDHGGWAQMTMPNIRPVDHKAVYAYTVVVTPTDEGLYMNACVYNIQQGATHPIGRWDAVQVK